MFIYCMCELVFYIFRILFYYVIIVSLYFLLHILDYQQKKCFLT